MRVSLALDREKDYKMMEGKKKHFVQANDCIEAKSTILDTGCQGMECKC